MTTAIQVRVMTKEEAEKWRDSIGHAVTRLRELLGEGYERKAWEALGFTSWEECLTEMAERYNVSLRHIKRLHAANQNARAVTNGHVDEIYTIPEGQLRPLSRLQDDESKREAWRQAVETAPNGKVTGAHVKRTVETYTAPASQPYRPEQVLNHPNQKPAPHVSHNSGNNEWYTPPEYIEAARQVLGEIDLDPASSEIANRTVKAGVIFTADMDGLQQDWFGRVWMNPPYSQPLINEFSQKLVDSITGGNVDEAIVLVNNATETRWFQTMLRESRAICLIEGRVKFLDENGNPSGAPLQGQAVLYLGRSLMEFHDAFEQFGTVLYV